MFSKWDIKDNFVQAMFTYSMWWPVSYGFLILNGLFIFTKISFNVINWHNILLFD